MIRQIALERLFCLVEALARQHYACRDLARQGEHG